MVETQEKPVLKPEDATIVFYCKDCQDVVDAKKLPTRYVYRCEKCGTKNVAFGTLKSIKSFYHHGED